MKATLRVHLRERELLEAWQQGVQMQPETVLQLTTSDDASGLSPLPQHAAALSAASTALANGARSALPEGLTERELEVFRLLVSGLTKPQIAQQLTISFHTVNAHVRSIYAKVGVSSRTAATRYALEHALV